MRTLAIVILSLALATAVATADTFRSEPNILIPDNLKAGVSDTLDASPSCTISDVDIALEITHTWIGDLLIQVSHGATTVDLVDRPGRAPAGTNVGCSSDLACVRQIVLDDDGGGIEIECAAPAACTTCFPGGQVPAANYIPNEPLTAFDTTDQVGEWILLVADNEALDTGTLCAWELRTTCGPSAVEPTTWGNIKARYSN
jgi:hypothetical protein